jgi:hypothetical protein
LHKLDVQNQTDVREKQTRRPAIRDLEAGITGINASTIGHGSGDIDKRRFEAVCGFFHGRALIRVYRNTNSKRGA